MSPYVKGPAQESPDLWMPRQIILRIENLAGSVSMCHRSTSDRMLNSCGPVRVFVWNRKTSISSEYFRQNDDFMLSHQRLCFKYKNNCVIGVLPTEWWFYTVTSGCLAQILKPVCHWSTSDRMLNSCVPVSVCVQNIKILILRVFVQNIKSMCHRTALDKIVI